MYTHTYKISKDGKAVRPEFAGKELTVTLPDPHGTSPLEEAVNSGRFGGVIGTGEGQLTRQQVEAAIVSAANRTWLIGASGDVREVLGDENGTLEKAGTVLGAYTFPVPRVVDPNAPKKAASSGEIVKAKATAKRVDLSLARLIRKGDARAIKQVLSAGFISQAQVDAETARQGSLDAEGLAKLDGEIAEFEKAQG
jgi:hypothetical protein